MNGSTPKEIMNSAAYRYAEDALSGKVSAPETIKKQAQHFLDDLKRAERGWRYVYSLDAGRRPIRFCEQFLTPTAGSYDTFHFLPWQEWVDTQAFGWIDRETDCRRYREVFEMVPRGNGKTARNSGKAGYMSTKGADKGAENYFLANNKEQARRCYMDFYRQMRVSPVLRRQLHLTQRDSWYEPLNVTVAYLANNAEVLDGLRPYFVLKDELEGERSFDQINQMLRPMKKRRQPLMWYTGTGGTIQDGPMVYYYAFSQAILNRDPEIDERVIDRFLPIIYEINPDLPYEDPANWAMANPSLGALLDMEDLLDDWARCQRSPKERVDFVTKQLNRFGTPPEAVYVDIDTIRRNDRAPMEASLVPPRGWGGFDLSKSEDFTSAAVVLDLPDGRVGIRHHSWVPEEKIRRGNGKEEKDWYEWQRRGLMTIVPGRYVKYGQMLEWFKQQRRSCELRGIGYDPYNSPELVKALTLEGFACHEIRQGPVTLNAPMKSLKEQLLDGNVCWNGDEMFEWYLRNVRLRSDFFDVEKENWMPTKKNRTQKIDGFMAALNAYTLRLRETEMASSWWNGSHVLGGKLW